MEAGAAVDSRDRLTWRTIDVDGRTAVYGTGGIDGPPVVFLHGWALGSRAYKRALKRLLTRGCRVYAPALPSFGGTQDLPRGQMTLAGYGQWVATFMREVGITEPALVIGHSFGGGVAIKLAELRPDLVRYLVLLNATGAVGARAPWDWAAGFARELWPITEVVELANDMRSDFLANVMRNPIALVRAGRIAQFADLRAEAAHLPELGVPILVLSSERDTVIPRQGFETLCAAIGTDGRVVSGRHLWLLADPDAFGSALGPLVDVQVDEHRVDRAAGRAETILSLLDRTHVPPRRARQLLSEVPPLWLISETPAVLASDLTLCHPPLRRHELRAVARPIEDASAVRLTVVARDRRGLLADSATLLAAAGLSITDASAVTWSSFPLALHSFVVEGGDRFDEEAWNNLGGKLQSMVTVRSICAPPPIDSRAVEVTVHSTGGDRQMVTVTTPDRRGVLATLCHTFAEGGFNIESLHAHTDQGVARDTFILTGGVDAENAGLLFSNRSAGTRLLKGWSDITSQVPGWTRSAAASAMRAVPVCCPWRPGDRTEAGGGEGGHETGGAPVSNVR